MFTKKDKDWLKQADKMADKMSNPKLREMSKALSRKVIGKEITSTEELVEESRKIWLEAGGPEEAFEEQCKAHGIPCGNDDDEETRTPIRSVKMTPGVLKLNKEAAAWAEKAAKKTVELQEAMKKLTLQAEEIKERLWSTVALEMGLTSTRYPAMAVNDETGEVDIFEENKNL